MHITTVISILLLQFGASACNGTVVDYAQCDVHTAPAPPNLTYLLTVSATELPVINIGDGGHGTRIFIPITGGNFSGPSIQGPFFTFVVHATLFEFPRKCYFVLTLHIIGTVAGVGGDWGIYDTTQTVFSPDAKIVLITDDGANILMSGRGRSPWIAYDFETGSEKYAWMNSVVGIGRIQVGDNNLTTDVFQVREELSPRTISVI